MAHKDKHDKCYHYYIMWEREDDPVIMDKRVIRKRGRCQATKTRKEKIAVISIRLSVRKVLVSIILANIVDTSPTLA